jgi:uncharacterized damage-inducible protein DinB
MEAIPQAIRDYAAWVGAHTSDSWLAGLDIEFQLEETWDCYSINDEFELTQDGYEVNAWFRHDWKPLSDDEIQRSLHLLAWSRRDLLKTVDNLSKDVLERKYPGERWSIAGILKHVGGAEWWYLHRLGLAFPQDAVPEDPFERLEKVRARLLEILPELAGSRQVVGVDGEFWSPRKLLRRAVWHECDHIRHIRKLL